MHERAILLLDAGEEFVDDFENGDFFRISVGPDPLAVPSEPVRASAEGPW